MLPSVDLSKACDTTNHIILLDKLLLMLLTPFFFFNSNRFGKTQAVLIFGFKSSPQMLTKGSHKDQY